MQNVKSLPPISYNFGGGVFTEEQILPRMEKMVASGAKRIMLDSSQLMMAADKPDFKATLQKCLAASGLVLFDAHAPHSFRDSLGCPLPDAFEHFAQISEKALNIAAELGVKTLTFHCARTRLVYNNAPASGPIEDVDLPGAKIRAIKQLENLLPKAEKLGIIIALENLFLPTGAAKFLCDVVREFNNPYLGLNYDSGHALLLERQEGKVSSDIAEWIRIGWQDDTVEFQDDQLDDMLDNVVTAHLHDNHGKEDEHVMPGQGIANWPSIVARLERAPRLVSLQSEVSPKCYLETPEIQIDCFRSVGLHRP